MSVEAAERLCKHHDITAFDCQEAPEYNTLLAEYVRLSDLALGPRVFVTLDATQRVSGYIAVCDLVLSTPAASGRFFFYCALAVSSVNGKATDAITLSGEAQRLLGELEATGKQYVGEAAAPGTNVKLMEVLQQQGFTRHPAGFFWLRPRPLALAS